MYDLWDSLVTWWDWLVLFKPPWWDWMIYFLKTTYLYVVGTIKVTWLLLIHFLLLGLQLIAELLLAIAHSIPQYCNLLVNHFLMVSSSVQTVLGKWSLRVFHFLHSHLCNDPVEEAESTLWPSFSCPSSSRFSAEKQRDCVIFISSVVVYVVLFVVVTFWLLTRRPEDREVGVDRGTNTPSKDDLGELPEGNVDQEEEDGLVKHPQIIELRDQLLRVSKLLESMGPNEAETDKDARIEELTFENRALRQNAIDESELQTCIVCRAEPRRIVLFPCRHLCLCESCNNHHFTCCPYCRTRCTRTEKIFL